MKYRSRNSSGTAGPRRNARPLPEAVLLALLLCAVPTPAGRRIIDDFTVSSAASRVAAADTLSLAVREHLLLKIVGDTALGRVEQGSYAVDVIALEPDRFAFFWAAAGAYSDTVCRTDYRLGPTAAEAQPPLPLFDNATPPVSYLHARGAADGYLAVFTDDKYKGDLYACNGAAVEPLYTVGNGPYDALAGETAGSYLVTHRLDNNHLVTRRVSADGPSITQTAVDTTILNTVSGDIITNSSVAVDTPGTIVVLSLRGAGLSPKRLEYKVMTTDFATIDSGVLAADVSDPAAYTYYEDAPIVSYAGTKFVAAHWGADGVYVDTISVVAPGTVETGSWRVAAGAGFRAATVAVGGGRLLVAWKGNLTGSSTRSVEGLRYRIRDGAVVWSDPDTLVFSDPDAPLPDYPTGPELNVAIDDSGSIAAVWPGQDHASLCIWANRAVRFADGYWVSPVDSTDAALGDSIRFAAGGIVDGGTGGYSRDSIRIGPSAGSFASWSPWLPLASEPPAPYGRGTNRYFQVKSQLYREEDDSLRGPGVDTIAVAWNLQPRLTALDSVRVDGARGPAVAFGDTIDVHARAAPIECFFTAHDGDTGDTVFSSVGWGGTVLTDTLIDTFDFAGALTLTPPDSADSVYECRFSGRDSEGWSMPPRSLFFRAVNAVPTLSVRAAWDSSGTGHDTVEVSAGLVAYVRHDDSLVLLYRGEDANDETVRARLVLDGAPVDSATQGSEARYARAGADFGPADNTVTVEIADPDTTVTVGLTVRANAVPAIDSLLFGGVRAADGEAVRVTVGAVASVQVAATDPNEPHWDSLSYRFTSETFDTVPAAPRFEFVPTLADSTLRVIVGDRLGSADTATMLLVYPWYTVDTVRNAGYAAATDTLANRLSFILGRDKADTVGLPLLNTGRDTLRIDSLRLSPGSGRLVIGVRQADTLAFFGSPGLTDSLDPIVLPPDSSTVLLVVIDPSGFTGDAVVRETIRIATNDPSHPLDTIAVTVEHNDLPVLDSVSFAYPASTPYWLAKRRRAAAGEGYRFPPHARIVLHFSEPMDSVSALGAVSGYSILDSAARGSVNPIAFAQEWTDGYRRLSLRPEYIAPNRHFGDAVPPAGLFIPTDSIAVRIAEVTDRARTPGGPNRLDVDGDAAPDPAGADTTITLRADSIRFRVSAVGPDSGATGVAPDTAITVRFSSPVYPGTIDTSRKNNRSLVVTTRYASLHDPARQVAFETVSVEGDRAVFVPAKSFFYGDSVYCRYRAVTGRDTLGYPVDRGGDGVPATLLDSTSSAEDHTWHFAVTDLLHSAVSPDSAATGVPFAAPITVRYPGPVFEGAVDTSRTGNRSLVVTSRFSGGEQIAFDSVVLDGSAATFHPAVRFFYGDSVHCRYGGLVTGDTTRFAIDLGSDEVLTSGDGRSWHFTVEELTLESVSPDSGASNVPFSTPITLRFSAPLTAAVFDTATGERNVSLRIHTRYSAEGLMPIRSVAFSPDSTTVTVVPAEKFFSNDSVVCSFGGISEEIRYGVDRAFLPDGGGAVTAAYTWHFLTEKVGFYTYPNPYKPGSDPRHRRAGGIYFKNLHALRSGINEVRLRVYSMDTHPVFDSREAGLRIRFTEGDPELKPVWRWNTRNSRGRPVASGVYLYLISDTEDEVLTKGKLMIVR